jgi:DivIVA domain-containing protein
MEQVDAFLDAVRDTFLGVRQPPVTAEEIRTKKFATTRLWPGYDEEEVDAFLGEAEARLRTTCVECEAGMGTAGRCGRCEPPDLEPPRTRHQTRSLSIRTQRSRTRLFLAGQLASY